MYRRLKRLAPSKIWKQIQEVDIVLRFLAVVQEVQKGRLLLFQEEVGGAYSSGNSWRQDQEAGGVQEEASAIELGSMIVSTQYFRQYAGPSSGI